MYMIISSVVWMRTNIKASFQESESQQAPPCNRDSLTTMLQKGPYISLVGGEGTYILGTLELDV